MTKNPGNPGLPRGTPAPLRHFQQKTTGKPAGKPYGGGGGSTAGGAAEPMMPMAIMNFTAPGLGGPSVDSDWGPPNYDFVETGFMVKGINWEVWKDAVLARGVNPALIIEDTDPDPNPNLQYNRIQFKGQAAIHLFSMFDIAFVGHAPPPGYIQAIKAASRVGTKVGTYFANFQSVAHVDAFASFWDTAEAVSLTRLRDTGIAQGNTPPGNPNAACTFADTNQLVLDDVGTALVDEGPAPCGTQGSVNGNHAGHEWICDLTLTDYKTNWFNATISAILTKYGVGGLDYMLVDNVLERPNWGAATNIDATYTDAAYTTGWKAMWALADQFLLSVAGTRLVGNCLQTTAAYSNTEVHRRYCEHFFHDEQNSQLTTSEDESVIHSRLTAGASQNMRMLHCQIKSASSLYNNRTFAATHVDGWSAKANGPGGTKGTWSGLLALARSLGILNSFYAVAGRSGSTFPLFWQDSFRRPA